MKLSQQLKEHGIEIDIPKSGQESEVTFQIDCPKQYCKAARDGGDKTPLKLQIIKPKYAGWHCRNCLWTGHIGEKPEDDVSAADGVSHETNTISAPKAPLSLPEEALAWLAAKGMTEADANNRKLSWDDERKAIKVPYFDNGKIVNAVLISVADGSSVLAAPRRVMFYGLDRIDDKESGVIIAHRELDAMILTARGFSNVIAIPNGGSFRTYADEFSPEPDKLAYLSAAADLVKKWHSVKLALDDTQEGLALRQELARRIGPGKCWSVKPSRRTIYETMATLGSEAVCADVNDAKPLPIRGLYEVDDFEKELVAYFEHGMASGVTTGWPNVDKLYTVVPGQLTVVTGIPNSGKSEWVDALSVNLALNHGWRFAAFSPENGKEAHATKLIEKRVEMSSDPRHHDRMSFDTFMSGALWVKNHFAFIESTDVMPTLEWILERAADAALRHGIKGLIIDPWNRIEKKLGERQSETDYVAESIPKILRFLVNYGVHGWLVVHPKQQQPDHKTGKIRAPSLYDMAGSAHFVNMCDNGVVIHRSDAADDATDVLLKKVRFKHVGRRGDTKLKYNRTTGRYSPLEQQFSADEYANRDTVGMKVYEADQ